MENSFFSSELVNSIRNNNGIMDYANGKKIMLPKTFGFCSGVFNAVSILTDTVKRFPDRTIWLMGDMIHNPAVNMHFASLGVNIHDFKYLDEMSSLSKSSTIFVIPAFGLPIEVDEWMRKYAASEEQIVDTTCPFVKRVWEQAKIAGKADNAIIIHGKHGHQETNAIWSRAIKHSRTCALLTSPDDARRFAANLSNIPEERLFNPNLLAERNWTLINQTTMLATETAEIAEILKEATWHTKTVELAGTLCPATRNRQRSAKELCEADCDCIYVLGGTESSNTTQLYRMAVEHLGEDRCFFVQSAQNICVDSVTHYIPDTSSWRKSPFLEADTIGILTGASCPDSELEKLILRLISMNGANPLE